MHAGGWLWQQADSLQAADITFSHAAGPEATSEQLEDARFAWTLVKHVKSNAITVAKQSRLLGMGSGQPNRVKSTQIALEKAGSKAQVRPPAQQLMPLGLLCLLSYVCTAPSET